MAARRVVKDSNEINAFGCPNGLDAGVVNTAKKPLPSNRKSPLSTAIAAPHKRASRVLGLALNVSTKPGWYAAASVWAVRLTDNERANIAYAAFQTLPPNYARNVFELACDARGAPLPSLIDPQSEARSWAETATREEVRAYCLASFRAMPESDKRAFLAFAQKHCGSHSKGAM